MKTIKELEKELTELREYHRSAWDTYGSELCTGDMIRQEKELEDKIVQYYAEERFLNRFKE